jgi:hypothetical protein
VEKLKFGCELAILAGAYKIYKSSYLDGCGVPRSARVEELSSCIAIAVDTSTTRLASDSPKIKPLRRRMGSDRGVNLMKVALPAWRERHKSLKKVRGRRTSKLYIYSVFLSNGESSLR